jgi:hypothetical protein
MLNHGQAEHIKYQDDIAFLLDNGNPYRQQVDYAHYAMTKRQGTVHLHVGSLTFGDDKKISALQAADVIAWGLHRFVNDKSSLNKGFEPIAEIFKSYHIHHQWEEKWLRDLSEPLLEIVHEDDVSKF